MAEKGQNRGVGASQSPRAPFSTVEIGASLLQGCRTNVRTLEPSVSTLMHMREWLTLGAKVVLERSNTSPNPGVRTQC